MAKVRYIAEDRDERKAREDLSRMWEQKVVAVLCSDTHFSHKPPLYRSKEPDWYKAMRRTWDQVRAIAAEYGVFVVCAGDVFDRWNPPPELLSFAMDVLPHQMFAVPGQHDLPYHRYEDIQRSAYWTMMNAGRICNLGTDDPVEVGMVRLHGFPWGYEVKPLDSPHDLMLELAVVHQYVWLGNDGYDGAPLEQQVSRFRKRGMFNYDSAVIGDNHVPWLAQMGNGRGGCILNCGSLMIRKSDEKHTPGVGLLHSDGTITRRELDTSQDVYLTPEVVATIVEEDGVEGFVEMLLDTTDISLDFAEVVKRELETRREGVRSKVLKAMGEEK